MYKCELWIKFNAPLIPDELIRSYMSQPSAMHTLCAVYKDDWVGEHSVSCSLQDGDACGGFSAPVFR
jgi:hypothetical protein